jgi:hypothetical protein
MQRWNLNSQTPVTAAQLDAELSRSLTSVTDEWDREFARNLLSGEGPRSRTPLHDRAESAMRAGIAAAVLVAASVDDPGALFLASVQGHVDPNDVDGIEDRFAVYVDRVPR